MPPGPACHSRSSSRTQRDDAARALVNAVEILEKWGDARDFHRSSWIAVNVRARACVAARRIPCRAYSERLRAVGQRNHGVDVEPPALVERRPAAGPIRRRGFDVRPARTSYSRTPCHSGSSTGLGSFSTSCIQTLPTRRSPASATHARQGEASIETFAHPGRAALEKLVLRLDVRSTRRAELEAESRQSARIRRACAANRTGCAIAWSRDA